MRKKAIIFVSRSKKGEAQNIERCLKNMDWKVDVVPVSKAILTSLTDPPSISEWRIFIL